MTVESISALGNYGGTAGLYGSYYDPYMMGAYGSYGMNNPMSMMGGYGSYGTTNPMMMGGLGMYNPTFMAQQTEMMKQMYSAQNEINKMQLYNQTEMHAAKEQAQVLNNSVHHEAFFRNLMEDGYVKQSIREIYDAIRQGKMDYVAHKYYELKQELLNKHSEYFKNSVGELNDSDGIREAISVLYSEIGAGYNPGGVKPDLRQDILAYGENAFQHGFNTTFMGNKDHTNLTAEETLEQIHGTPVVDKGSKAKAHWLGEWGGHIGEGLVAGGVGAVTGGTAWGLGKLFKPSGGFGKFGTWAKLGAIGLAALDVAWQLSRD